MTTATAAPLARLDRNGALLLGTGLAFASLILVPALATQMGLGTALTGALRIALMRASSRVAAQSVDGKTQGEDETAPVCFACH